MPRAGHTEGAAERTPANAHRPGGNQSGPTTTSSHHRSPTGPRIGEIVAVTGGQHIAESPILVGVDVTAGQTLIEDPLGTASVVVEDVTAGGSSHDDVHGPDDQSKR